MDGNVQSNTYGALKPTMGIFRSGSNVKYFTVGILTFINLLNYMDRYTLAGELVR